MQIDWSNTAVYDLQALYAYIAQHSATNARRVHERVRISIERLSSHPHMGRPGRVAGTRELVVSDTPYIAAYRTLKNRIEILAIYHSARLWPEKF